MPNFSLRYREDGTERAGGDFSEPSEPIRIGRRLAASGADEAFVEDTGSGEIVWSSRSYRPNRSSTEDQEAAARIRETFVDRPPEKVTPVNWTWPKKLRHAGKCLSVMYSSDKWRKRGDHIDYKHVAEGPQDFFVASGFLRDYETDPSGNTPLKIYGPEIEVNGQMPTAIAVLADVIGVQVSLHTAKGRGGYSVPSPPESNAYQIDIEGATLAAAKHPETGQTFLVIYNNSRVLALITGDILDVKKDGIVG